MNTINQNGPFLTYVTDDELDRGSQERVLSEFVACAGVHPLRVAFRVPKWTDGEVDSLVGWYLKMVDGAGMQGEMEPPLVHDRPETVDRFPGAVHWLPWRNRDLVRAVDVGRVAISTHSVEEAHGAVAVGASELIFGHVFTSESHPGAPGRGLTALLDVKDAVRAYENPPRVTAIGGINEYTIPEIGGSRHCSVATMRMISRSPDIAITLDRFRTSWVAARINADIDEHQRNPLGNPSSIFF